MNSISIRKIATKVDINEKTHIKFDQPDKSNLSVVEDGFSRYSRMILAKKVRLKPTKDQEGQLWKSVGTARWAYNWALARQEENYNNIGKYIDNRALRKELTILKQTEEFKWLYEVSNNITKQAIKDLCIAYKRFLSGLTSKPKFKSKRKSRATFYNDAFKLNVKEERVLIEKVGWIKTSEQIPINSKYTNPRINFDGKYWYLSVGIEQEIPHIELSNVSLGVDVGVKELAVCSDGIRKKNINKTSIVRKVEKRIRRLQRQVSRKYEMNKEGSRYVKTSNILKIERNIQLLHRRLSNIRKNHLHQSTNDIVKTKPYRIVMETLNIKGMMKNKHLSKVIAKQCLYEFKKQIQYKCMKFGIEFVEAELWYPSSKRCSNCGSIKKILKLSERLFRCTCGYEIDRDLNAAINLAQYQLAI